MPASIPIVRQNQTGFAINISHHARKRAHERAGFNCSAIHRTATKAARFGELVAGSWSNVETGMPKFCFDLPNIVRHGQFLYFFSAPREGATTLITLYQDPMQKN